MLCGRGSCSEQYTLANWVKLLRLVVTLATVYHRAGIANAGQRA
jgi:hypothetical protein